MNQIIQKTAWRLCACLLLFGCGGSEKPKVNFPSFKYHPVVDVEQIQDSVNLTNLLESYRYVPLETNDSCLLGEKIYEREKLVWQDKIFLQDKRGVYVFDLRSGKFLYSLTKKGRGPGEFDAFNGLSMSIDKGILYLWQPFSKMLCFRAETGEYLREFKLPRGGVNTWIHDDKAIMYKANKDEAAVNGDTVTALYYPLNNPDKAVSLDYPHFYKTNWFKNGPIATGQAMYWMEIWFNQLYKWDGEKFRPYFFCDFGERNLTSAKDSKGKEHGKDYIMQCDMCENEDMIHVEFYYSKKWPSSWPSASLLFDKRTKKFMAYKAKGATGACLSISPQGGCKKEFWSVASAGTLVWKRKTIFEEKIDTASLRADVWRVLKNIRESDNPVLMFSRYKPSV
ncbi:MAG: 6-bladed beta-propeller [Cytophagales bacterium]|nr:6-bladed beta-propeller [Cytophagales bacterium]